MKTSIKSIIYAFALSTVLAFNASAEDKEVKKATGFATGIFTTKEGKINVNIDKYNKKTTTIVLEDQHGNVMYKEIVRKGQTKFRRTLDVSQLAAGEYELKVASNGEKQTKKLDVSDKKQERLISMN